MEGRKGASAGRLIIGLLSATAAAPSVYETNGKWDQNYAMIMHTDSPMGVQRAHSHRFTHRMKAEWTQPASTGGASPETLGTVWAALTRYWLLPELVRRSAAVVLCGGSA